MRAETLTAVVMVTMTAVSTETCQKLDPVVWDYTSCPHPGSNEWNRLKNETKCDKDRVYHCASNSQGCDVQLCAKRIYCEAGHHPLLDTDKKTVICAPCPAERFQTVGFWSNERSYCEHEKTKCDGIGQIECQPGSTITDRSCRCNITQNLALQFYGLHNKTCCDKNDPLCECIQFKSPCQNGTVRHDNYKCLMECPPNSYRLWDSETCYPNSTTVTVEMTTAYQTPASGSTGLPDNVGLIVGLTVGLILVGLAGLIVGLCVCRIRKKRKKGLPKDEEQAMPLQEQKSGEGRPGGKTSNGHINGQKSVDTANGHIVGQEPVDMEEEEEETMKKYVLQSPGAEADSSTKGIGKDLRENTISKKEEDATEEDRLLQSEAGSSTKGKNLRENKVSNEEEDATEKDQLLQPEARSSTKGKNLRENKVSNEGERVGDESVEARGQPLVKEITGGQVIVKNIYQYCVINDRRTKNNIQGGRGNTVNLGRNNKTKTTIIENPVIGNEDIGLESIESTSERSSLVEENPDNQWNSHTHDNQSQQDISRIGSSSEETAVKLIGSDPHESTEEVRTEEMCKDDDNSSNEETKKKEVFFL